MTRPSRWIFIALIVVLTGILAVWRVASTTYGRDVNDVVNLSNSSQMRSFKTVGDFAESGRLSLYEGKDILNFFRIQIPINPYIYTQAQQMDVRSDDSYLITEDPGLFRLIRSNLSDVHVYEDARNIVYEGVRLPNAYVFETRRSISDLKEAPLPVLHKNETDAPGFLHVRSPEEWRAVNAMATVPPGLSLIIDPGISVEGLSADRVQRLGEIHVIGQNARLVSNDEAISGQTLSVVDFQGGLLLNGLIPPVPAWLQALMVLVIAGSFLVVGGTTAPWFSWFMVWALSLTMVDVTHGLVVGMFGGAILDRMVRGHFPGVFWLLLWPILVYGLGYGSFLVVPHSVVVAWFFIGLFVSTFVFFPSVYFRLGRTLRQGDLLVIGIIGFIGYLFLNVPVSSALPADLGGVTLLEIIILALIPPCVSIASGTVDHDTRFWVVPMFLWGVLMLYPGGLQHLVMWLLLAFCYFLGKSRHEVKTPAWIDQ